MAGLTTKMIADAKRILSGGEITREDFERQLRGPPHAARLIERSRPFVGALDKTDRAMLLEWALERLWETRQEIEANKDLLTAWADALAFAAALRPRWRVAKTFAGVCTGYRWVKGTQLGRQFL